MAVEFTLQDLSSFARFHAEMGRSGRYETGKAKALYFTSFLYPSPAHCCLQKGIHDQAAGDNWISGKVVSVHCVFRIEIESPLQDFDGVCRICRFSHKPAPHRGSCPCPPLHRALGWSDSFRSSAHWRRQKRSKTESPSTCFPGPHIW